AGAVADIPFLPVRMFKRFGLKSIPDANVFKTLTSSGTTGQTPSRIFLDSRTAQLQARALVKVIQSFIGPKRLPMLIIDHPAVVKDRRFFSARGAGILGLSNFGRDHFYALADETMALRMDELRAWLEKHRGQTILIFGFTFMVWKYLVQALQKSGETLKVEDAILIHSGGWKKLQDEAVSNEVFKAELKARAGVSRVHNFYGMVEQTGSIYVECEAGHLHAPILSDVIVRDPRDWSVLPPGQEGVIEVVSALPHSYPGHALMTEDRGRLDGEDNCPCGRKGRYFTVFGRVPMAEMRGCSDTHAGQAA
ncbi:MAG: acyl-protein synthetase, partial [Proteobacteria bacterium]|nr:acyl-protein synthetase [Pseudomonadota bacterium]